MPVRRHPVAVSSVSEPLDRLPLDTALIGRLRGAYEQARENGDRLAEVFYAKLFAAAPGVRPLFREDPLVQRRKLIEALDTVVRNLDRPAENASMIASLGRRHAAYGARPEHYDLVVDLLADSMGELLGDRPGSQRIEEWRMALRLVGRQMVAAAEADGDGRGAAPEDRRAAPHPS